MRRKSGFNLCPVRKFPSVCLWNLFPLFFGIFALEGALQLNIYVTKSFWSWHKFPYFKSLHILPLSSLQNNSIKVSFLYFFHLGLQSHCDTFICFVGCPYRQRKSKWMKEQSEIDRTLLNLFSLTDLIKAQTKETTKKEKGWLHPKCEALFLLLCFSL